MKKLIFLIFPLFISAQDVAIGHWKDYLSYNYASYICEANEKIYCVASGGLYYVNKEDMTINRMSKITGLSDVGVKQIAYSKSLDITVITYENCNIDLIKNNQIVNISDIKRKEIAGLKTINNITIDSGTAYFSSSFGLVLVDLEKEEIKDTYKIGENGNFVSINDCYIDDTCIFVGTTDGAYFADKNSNTLFDFNSWTKHPSFSTEVSEIIVNSWGMLFNNQYPYVKVRNSNGYYLEIGGIISIYQNGNLISEIIADSNFSKIQDAWVDKDDILWVADSVNGLLKFTNFEYTDSYTPSGPVRNEIYSIEYLENKLYQCHGGHKNFGTNALINDGVSIKLKYDEWINYDRYKLGNARDILEVAVNNGAEYYSSWYHGIPKMKNGELVIKYDYDNTNGILDTAYYSNNRIRISDIKFDSEGNMWALSSEVNHPLVVKTKDDNWHSYSINQNQVALFFDDLLIDSYSQKWGIMGRGAGIFVYNDNNTIENPNDDQYKILSMNIGNGNLPSLQTYCFAEDLESEIWIGTDKGIAVFYDPSAVFSGYNFDAQQILITEGDYGQYLLSEEKVKCITIDGANRKWIGTEKSGVFLLSDDGTKEIHHFTKDNSPLFDNNIIDIAINNENGEVFIGTEKGLISYRSDATEGVAIQNNTKVFPNPVKETYNGPIAISGLVSNANVKITDAGGNLVFETTANGGQAIWNGLNKNGERASTGVYLVFSTDLYGEQKVVSKILFIH
ncbi:MAG: hypothetical protein QF383_05680 [Flavobacteriales bacterium]|nr:hypothetical protein [Flavobacteriales bacterium]